MNRRRFCAAAGAGVLLAGCKSLPKPDGGPVRVFIIHGYGATVADHWFPWLAQQLRRRGMEVVPVPLPDSLHRPEFGNIRLNKGDTREATIAYGIESLS